VNPTIHAPVAQSAAVMPPLLTVSIGQGVKDARPSRHLLTFDMLVTKLVERWHAGKLSLAQYLLLKNTDAGKQDKDTRYFSFAEFRDGHRTNDNAERLFGFVGDFDGGQFHGNDIAAKLAGYTYLIYTTYSHSDEHPKYRLVVPYAAPISPDDHRRMFVWFNGPQMFAGALDSAASDPARLSYFPSHCEDRSDDAEHSHRSGVYFDAVGMLPNLPAAPPRVQKSAELTTEPRPEWSGPTDDAALLKIMMNDRRPKALFGAKIKFQELYERNVEKLAIAYPSKEHGKEFNGNSADLALCNLLAFGTGCHGERMAKLWRESPLGQRDKLNREDYVANTIAEACADVTKVYCDKVPTGTVKLHATDAPADVMAPWRTALLLLTAQFMTGELPELKHWNGDFYHYQNGIWVPVSKDSIRARTYPYLEAAGENPKPEHVSGVVDALASRVWLYEKTKVPSLLSDPNRDLSGAIVCLNGAFDLDANERLPLSPNLFALNALPFNYDPHALEPVEWLKFLSTQWAADPQSVETLQEFAGLLLTPVTRFQKILFMVGPPRSGRGTILRVLRAMIGADNVVGPTLASLSRQFGLEPLIGKLAAFIGDVRLGANADQSTIVERLLSLSGEDALPIERKRISDYSGKLFVRFIMASNEMPRLSDASGAMASRFIVLEMKQSFLGREDTKLEGRLMAELPQILSWSVRGRRRLFERGHFVQPESSKERIQQLQDLGNPMAVFIRDTCTVAPGLRAWATDLYGAWTMWSHRNGRKDVSNLQMFAKDLVACMPALKEVRPRRDGKQHTAYEGIALTDAITIPPPPGPAPVIAVPETPTVRPPVADGLRDGQRKLIVPPDVARGT
jgi:putative DNA primase/helicase